jgi:hypothetical protein
MRIQTLAFMATWVVFGVNANGDDFEATFVPSNRIVKDGLGQSSYNVTNTYTITKADIARTSLYLVQTTEQNGQQISQKQAILRGRNSHQSGFDMSLIGRCRLLHHWFF